MESDSWSARLFPPYARRYHSRSGSFYPKCAAPKPRVFVSREIVEKIRAFVLMMDDCVWCRSVWTRRGRQRR